MLSLIQTETVVNHHWLTSPEFTNIVAISQMTPGPIGINSATYCGYAAVHNAGYTGMMAVLGSATATIALVLPSFVLMLLAAIGQPVAVLDKHGAVRRNVLRHESAENKPHTHDMLGRICRTHAALLRAARQPPTPPKTATKHTFARNVFTVSTFMPNFVPHIPSDRQRRHRPISPCHRPFPRKNQTEK